MRRRLAFPALLLACFAYGWIVVPSSAPASSAPGVACSWHMNGLEEDGWVCLCQRVRFRREWKVMCSWHLATTVDGRISAKKKAARIVIHAPIPGVVG